jgi:hypothetical protein
MSGKQSYTDMRRVLVADMKEAAERYGSPDHEPDIHEMREWLRKLRAEREAESDG